MNRQEIIDAARKEIEQDKAAIDGMDKLEKRAFWVGTLIAFAIGAIFWALARWIF